MYHSRVALLSVLVAPVRVVVAVVGQPVHLVSSGALRGALGGVAPGYERERVAAVSEHLLHSEEVRERVVERALDVAFVGPSVGDVGREGPSLAVKAGVKGVHSAQSVAAVGAAEGEPVAYGHRGGAEVVVVRAAHARHGEVVALEGQRRLHVARLLVQSADPRVSELSRLHVVDWSAVDVDVVVLLVERTVTEAHRREEVAHLARVDVRVGVDDGDVRRHVVVLAQLCLRECECRLAHDGALQPYGVALGERQGRIAQCHHCNFQLVLHR